MPRAPAARRLYLWSDRLLYFGPLGLVRAHRHAAAVWLLGLDGEFRIAGDDGAVRSCRSALVGAGCRHRLDTGATTMAVFYIDPESDHPAFVAAQAGRDGIRVGLDDEARRLAVFADLHRRGPAAACALASIEAVLEPERAAPDRHRRLDPRIRRSVEALRTAVTENRPLAALARAAALSPTRFIHLFRAELGVAPRRLRQWNRLRQVVIHYAGGHSLTEAALAAGFASSSHFATAFRDMFGIRPSLVLRRNLELVIEPGAAG